MSATGGCEIHAGDGAKLDGETLQEDGEEVAEEDDEEQFVLVGSTCCNVCGIITRINLKRRVSMDCASFRGISMLKG